MRITRVLLLGGVLLVLAAAVAATSCQVYSKGVSLARVGADYSVRLYETWLVQGERRVVRVTDVVRLVERDRGVTITFLHEVRLGPAFLSGG